MAFLESVHDDRPPPPSTHIIRHIRRPFPPPYCPPGVVNRSSRTSTDDINSPQSNNINIPPRRPSTIRPLQYEDIFPNENKLDDNVLNMLRNKQLKLNLLRCEDKSTCSICLENDVNDDNGGKLPCGHTYHNTCITSWFTCDRCDCPCCRVKTDVTALLKQ